MPVWVGSQILSRIINSFIQCSCIIISYTAATVWELDKIFPFRFYQINTSQFIFIYYYYLLNFQLILNGLLHLDLTQNLILTMFDREVRKAQLNFCILFQWQVPICMFAHIFITGFVRLITPCQLSTLRCQLMLQYNLMTRNDK